MHPAFSVIFFTTASGAGYGLLALMGVFGAAGMLPAERWFGLMGLIIALGLISAGLMASTFHLGHPERAWRAVTQWRSSWLSREGVLAIITYIPAGGLGIGWVFFENTQGIWGMLGITTAVLAALTVMATAMIYRSLKTIHQWHNSWTLPGYLTLSFMTGTLLLSALSLAFGAPENAIQGLSIIAVALAWVVKYVYWHFIDTTQSLATANSAIAVDGGRVSPLDAPHSSDNYLLKEMGFKVAQKHSRKLRTIAKVLLFATPLVLSLGVYFTGDLVATALAVLAVLSAGAGVVVERWLFFAEARHTVNLYYGAQSV